MFPATTGTMELRQYRLDTPAFASPSHHRQWRGRASRRARPLEQSGEPGLRGFESPHPGIRTVNALVEGTAETANHPAERDTDRDDGAHDERVS